MIPKKTTSSRRRRNGGAVQRERLKDAAIRLFAAKGFHATSVRQIAGRVSMQPGILYHYFRSKQDLLREICVDYAIRDQAQAELILQTVTDAVDAAAALLRIGIETEMASPEAYAVLRSEARALKRQHRAQVADALRIHRKNWLQVIERGIEQGVFDCSDPRLAAIAVSDLQDVSGWYSPEGRLQPDELIPELVKLGLGILGHRCDERCATRICSQLYPAGMSRELESSDEGLAAARTRRTKKPLP